MPLSLPNDSTEFCDPNYWKKFFASHKSPFEWYGDFSSLGQYLDRYLKHSDEVLQVGCGNSKLASELHDSGYCNITSIDTNSSVINDQISRNQKRKTLKFEVQSVLEMKYADEQFSVVIDKGTLDALLPPNDADAIEPVTRMLQQITRVLRAGGRYLVVTLAQEHIIRLWIEWLSATGLFLLRIHKVNSAAIGFAMPVFILVATKLKSPLTLPLTVDFFREVTDKGQRLSSVEEVLESIISEQFFSRFVHTCSKTLSHEVSIVINDGENRPRYQLFVVDNHQLVRMQTFSVFIVPIGRDGDWLFATEKGRRSLRVQCNKDRLAVVTLYRDAEYAGGLSLIKDELAAFVMRLNPVKDGRVEFLSMGEHDVKRTVATGSSAINGRWSVEDVLIREREYRRLVFLSSQNLVQSEAPLRIGRKGRSVVCLDELSCEHHEIMLLSLILLPSTPLLKPDKSTVKVGVLGLGGGLLAAFIIRNFAQSRVVGVELDGDVVQLATKYFSFPFSDSRMNVRVMDALDYLQEAAEAPEEEKLDALFVDLAGSMSAEGLSCPPPPFLTHETLQNMAHSLTPHGVLALNLVTRDEDVSKESKEKVAKHFSSLCVVSSEEDVNEVLIASRASPSAVDVQKMAQSLNRDKPWIASIATKIEKLMVLQ